MHVWRASGLLSAALEVQIRSGGALLDLFERRGRDYLLLCSNDGVGGRLNTEIAPEPGLVRLALRVHRLAGEDAADPPYLEVSQDGAVLPVDDGGGPPPLNGPFPYDGMRLGPAGSGPSPRYYYFCLSFT